MIDFVSAYRNTERRIIPPSFGGGVIEEPTKEDYEETHCKGFYFDDKEFLESLWTGWSHNNEFLHDHTLENLPDGANKLLPIRVYGYVLLSRKWRKCSLDQRRLERYANLYNVEPLDIDLVQAVPAVKAGENDGFSRLVMPPGHRDIVRSLVQTHIRKVARGHATSARAHQGFDVVRGKGRGLIILLHGAPGVGKTSTAECVAANAGKPLFPITCGDLGGDTAHEVEGNLEKFFDLARKWNCVLLLDEADVFLSSRVAGNIQQNSLVSGEYFSFLIVVFIQLTF